MSVNNISTNESEKLIRHIERVAQKVCNSKLKPDKIKAVSYSLKRISGFLDCSKDQAMLFSVILSINFKKNMVGINDIADFLKCNSLIVARFIPDFEKLEKKRLIRSHSDGKKKRAMLHDINYFITRDVLNVVFRGNNAGLKKPGNINMVEFLSEVKELIQDRDENKLTFNELIEDVERLMDDAIDVPMVRIVKHLDLDEFEKILLLYVCNETINGIWELDLDEACEKIYDDTNLKFSIKRGLVKGEGSLIQQDLVKLEDGYFRSDREILLTDKALDLLFKEDADVFLRSGKNLKHLIKYENIELKKMFFNSEEKTQLDFLKDALHEKNFTEIKERLKNQKMKTGFTILFHGSPGTGKTESVYQLAMETGRNILKVEISETKSMWFGESEKKIKAVFDQYRDTLKLNTLAPILLFNEADGVLSKRKELGSSPVDQTENAIQNIILQEIEDFEGILIATTNLTANLDKAFERRFLYKIRFGKPAVEASIRIWRDKISGLSHKNAKLLAQEFDFSGGQIENIARKYQMEVILNGNIPGISDLRRYCEEEGLETKQKKEIGF